MSNHTSSITVVSVLIQLEAWQEAERVARSIMQERERAEALRDLARALAHASVWQEAERVARSLEQGWWRAEALRDLARALAHTSMWREAERVARSIEQEGERTGALLTLASALVQAGEQARAWSLVQEIDPTIVPVPPPSLASQAKKEERRSVVDQVACRNPQCFMSDVEQTPVHLKRGSCIEVRVFDEVAGAGCFGLFVGIMIFVTVWLGTLGIVGLEAQVSSLVMFSVGIMVGTAVFLRQTISSIRDRVKSENAMKYQCSVCKKIWYITESGTLREQ